MYQYRSESKEALLAQLDEMIGERLPEERAAVLKRFASIYYRSAAAEDLAQWRLDDLYGSTLACWQFLQRRDPGNPRVRVFNPDYEQHGWQSTHTVIEVLLEDMPFIVDSLRMEINRRNLTIHAIHNSVLNLCRNSDNQLESLLEPEYVGEDVVKESLVFIEIDRHTDQSQLVELEQIFLAILEDVRLAVDDFYQMVAQCELLQAEFENDIPGLPSPEVTEVRDFLQWLELNFTFLGYEAFRVATQGETSALVPVEGSQLGLMKLSGCADQVASERAHMMDAEAFAATPELLVFSKSSRKSRVHRPAYPDLIRIKQFDSEGKLCGEVHFLGLYTSSVYIQSSRFIPVVRRKVDAVMALSGLHRQGHDWKELLQILEIYPRDDLFQGSVEELAQISRGILHIHERRQIRLFLRRDSFGQYFSCLVYAPRDVYSTHFRQKVQAILCEALDCDLVEFTTYFSESILARTQFILRSSAGDVTDQADVERLEQQLRDAGRSWADHFYDALVESLGEEQGILIYNRYNKGVPAGYCSDFNPRTAVVDMQHIRKLSAQQPMQLSFYRALEKQADTLNFKLFNLNQPLPLSDLLPVLENLGLRVIDEHPYRIDADDHCVWIHDFNLIYTGQESISLNELKDLFQEAFLSIWRGRAANDDFNRLVLSARIGWREVAMLRAYAAYMKQIRFPISSEAVSATLNHQVQLTALLVKLFNTRFDPTKSSVRQHVTIKQQLLDGLDEVASLNEDKVIRQYLNLIEATLRTNYFQTQDGQSKAHMSFKLSPREIPDIPLPRPMFEIFVYSPDMEGVHLRGGKVARGGLRWSDRQEDYRTEVLGLVKAQQVKNAVIVPVGAKGGFVAKKLHEGMSRDEWLAEGVRCYRTFISGLLDITDNLKDGVVVAPPEVLRHDEDDTYLVVAADKGTATFSDIANEIAASYDFWLGDAFASGGSQGYDHKKMGITARGGWVSVERHFREMGVNTAEDNFSVVAIGDMSGDVFGNGMLLSRHICLVAAFNHQHIFIDPTPDPARSWEERKRLFDLPRSSWTDYDSSLISEGGGIFSRNAKSVTLSKELRQLIGVTQERMTPTELIRALLRAPVDLLWNGGIGTYVKASDETDMDIGDKANDALRINGRELRAKVVGEGGNLGLSQKARVEYALNGGRMNTDFIDNAGGVDCSDHEVNIKILLDQIVDAGDMTSKQRNRLLEDMTEDVSRLVLRNNYRQVQAISLAEMQALNNMSEYRRFISGLEHDGKLDRELEFIPDDEQLAERHIAGFGLTRPELSVLISYSKAEMKQALLETPVPDDAYLSGELRRAFPGNLLQDFSAPLAQHRLRREIVSTEIANHIVNFMGINFVDRLIKSTGADVAQVTRSYILARDVIGLQQIWQEIEWLDHQVAAQTQMKMMLELQHLARRATRWFVRNRRGEIDCAAEVQRCSQQLEKLVANMSALLCGEPLKVWQRAYDGYIGQGIPESLAAQVAASRILNSCLSIIEVAAETGVPVEDVARAFFELDERLQLHWFSVQLDHLTVDNYWQGMARETFRDDLELQQRHLLHNILSSWQPGEDVNESVADWQQQHSELISRWGAMLDELKGGEQKEYAMFAVAVRELADLARNSHCIKGDVAEPVC
ncbi:NAD-glutamate dehydrogenase [Marinobacterium jannaschii]|uniref:NAD-glutamate dehydrogenase n=1 Tax=Marinobacterium jannaschii TaxID=64970 RepID=UPI000487B756|nr:NAD-glutamate dehydrogenase [Marinobacterium jannaschii]